MSAASSYTSKSIQSLTELEHIRLSPGMYIGSTQEPCHLLEEAFDNSLDESIAGHANIVAINIDTKTNMISVLDNGRGIPIEGDVPILISTKLFTGGKFQSSDGKKDNYQICSGLHGIGLVAVNALSDEFLIEIYRDNQHAIFSFIDAKLKQKKIEKFDGERPFSTKVSFKPSPKIFESLLPDVDRIRKRLQAASAELENVTFVLNVDDNREIIKINHDDFFRLNCFTSGDTEATPILNSYSKSKNSEEFNVSIAYSFNGSLTPRIISSVNLLPVESGGTHVGIISDLIRTELCDRAKKLKLHIMLTDYLVGLRCWVNLRLLKPEFHGQTKDKIISRKSYFDDLVKLVKPSITKMLDDNPEQTAFILEHLEAYRKKMDSKKITKGVEGRRASTKFTKLRDCTGTVNCELYCCEGDSGAGSIISCRNPKIHAVLPLKGKIPSAVNKKDILKNKEITELIQSLGTGFGKDFDITRLKYSKIICATDADPDGSHIASLLMMVFAILMPEIIQGGFLYIARTPLYAINEKTSFIPIWDDESLEAARMGKRNITRFKGLGELNSDQAKIVLIDEGTRKLIPVLWTEDLQKIVNLFLSSVEKLKLMEEMEVYG